MEYPVRSGVCFYIDTVAPRHITCVGTILSMLQVGSIFECFVL